MFKNIKRKILIALSTILLIIISLWVTILWLFTFHYTIKVNDIQTTYNKNIQDSDFLVFTDVTTFKLDDSILFFRFDSSDEFGKIKKGGCYHIGALGFRIPIFSIYPNIRYMKEMPCKEIAYNEEITIQMIKSLKETSNPELQNDILNNLDYIRKVRPDFKKKYQKMINEYEKNWVAQV